METAANVKGVGIYDFPKIVELSRSVPTLRNDGHTRAEGSMRGVFTARGTSRTEFCTFPRSVSISPCSFLVVKDNE